MTEERIQSASSGLEHVNVKVSIEHQYRGDVHVEIVSPNDIKSAGWRE